MDKKTTSNSRKSGRSKRKRIAREAVKTVLFYENLASHMKKKKKKASDNEASQKGAKQDDFRQRAQEEQSPVLMRDHANINKEEGSLVRTKKDSDVLSVELTKEEWNALHGLLKDLQAAKEKENCQKAQEPPVPKATNRKLHTAQEKRTYRTEEKREKVEPVSKASGFSFLDFYAEFDVDMLWEDTNLDDYADILPADLLRKLKAKQRQKNRQAAFTISEEDYEDEIQISEDDYEE